MCLSLIEVAEKKGEPERVQACWNAFHCQNYLIGSNGRLYGKYYNNKGIASAVPGLELML